MALWVAPSASACGGEVVVDRDPRGASTGAPDDDDDDDGTSSSADPGSACVTRPDVVGTVNAASCVSTVELEHCITRCDDAGFNDWSVRCDDQSCQCQWNGEDICLCVVSGSAGSICGGDIAPCCPDPWIAN